MSKANISIIMVVILLILSYFSIKDFFIPGFFPIHDDTQVARVYEMGKALKEGQFPVRWVADLGYGYGYPIFNFYAPFAYYIGGFFVLIGFSALDSTKLMMILGVIFSGISMYFFAKEFWGRAGALISALLYIYFPYHAANIYVRGDVAEFYAYAWIPFMCWGFYRVFKNGNNTKGLLTWMAVGALGYAGIISSHNLSAMMVTPFLAILIVASSISLHKTNKNFKITYYLLLTALLGIGLSAFYWLPALLEMHYTNVLSQIGGGADYKDHFVCLPQLWNSQWGFGGSAKGCLDGIAFQIGKLHILLGLAAFICSIVLWRKHRVASVAILIATLFSLIIAFLTLEWSKPVWDTFAPMAFIQYPWRFLGLLGFSLSFAAGSILYVVEHYIKFKYRFVVPVIVCVLVGLILYFYGKFFVIQTISGKTSRDYTSTDALRIVASRISDEYMPKGFTRPAIQAETVTQKFVPLSNTLIIQRQTVTTQKASAEIAATAPGVVHIQTAHFPAWVFYLDREKISPQMKNTGYFVTIPKGIHILTVVFEQTRVQMLGNVISFASAIVLLLGIIRNQRNYKDV